jgi:biopolymer transport protein TolR
MAFSSGGGKKGLSDINVTPLVDVMLVLLIIFMVTAPLIQQGVKINLPATKASEMEDKHHNLVLSIDKDSKVFLDDVEVPLDALRDTLAANNKVKDGQEVDIKADRNLPYGTVVEVMAKAQAAGVTNIGMVTDPTQGDAADEEKAAKKKH